MSDDRAASPPPRPRPNRRRRVVTVVVVVVAAVLLYFVAAAVIPRWWGQRVGDVVGGRLTVGALYGLFLGFVFTVVPLLLAASVVRWRSGSRTWVGWIGWLFAVLVTAAPNLMTLGIVLGSSNAAHAGDRILDVDGPGFRLWSLVGSILGGVAVLTIVHLVRSRRRSRRQADELRDELRTREEG